MLAMATKADFEKAFLLTVAVEGGHSLDQNDPGNWTGGRCGAGECRGTKYGISAAAWPDRDIANLTLDEAQKIYREYYWSKAGCNDMPPLLAALVFDAAVNNGVSRAVRWLQQCCAANEDGIWGPATRRAVYTRLKKDEGLDLAHDFHAHRLLYMSSLSQWHRYGLGWSRRLARVATEAGRIWPVPPDLTGVDDVGT